jgi:hypothetical protein
MSKSTDEVPRWSLLLKVLASMRGINQCAKLICEGAMETYWHNRCLLVHLKPSVYPLFGLKCRHSIRLRHTRTDFAWRFYLDELNKTCIDILRRFVVPLSCVSSEVRATWGAILLPKGFQRTPRQGCLEACFTFGDGGKVQEKSQEQKKNI